MTGKPCATCRVNPARDDMPMCSSCLAVYKSRQPLRTFAGDMIQLGQVTADAWIKSTYPNGTGSAPVVKTVKTASKPAQKKEATVTASKPASKPASNNNNNSRHVEQPLVGHAYTWAHKGTQHGKGTIKRGDPVTVSRVNKEGSKVQLTGAIAWYPVTYLGPKVLGTTHEPAPAPADTSQPPTKAANKRRQSQRHNASGNNGTSTPASQPPAARKPAPRPVTVASLDSVIQAIDAMGEQLSDLWRKVALVREQVEALGSATFDDAIIRQQAKEEALSEIMARLTGQPAPAAPAPAARQQASRQASASYARTSASKGKASASNGGMREGSLMWHTVQILGKARKPLTPHEIVEQALARGWQTAGDSPDATLASKLYTSVQSGKGTFVRHETPNGIRWSLAS